jgi:hypothetical protein
MNRWERCGTRAEIHWVGIWGRGPVAQTCIAVTMFFVGIALFFDALLLLPYSIFNALREKK